MLSDKSSAFHLGVVVLILKSYDVSGNILSAKFVCPFAL
jgi:hypothetical protein